MTPNTDTRPRIELQPLAYTIDQAAVVCGRTRRQLYKDIAAGLLRSYKHGRRRMVTVDELQRHVSRLAKGGTR